MKTTKKPDHKGAFKPAAMKKPATGAKGMPKPHLLGKAKAK